MKDLTKMSNKKLLDKYTEEVYDMFAFDMDDRLVIPFQDELLSRLKFRPCTKCKWCKDRICTNKESFMFNEEPQVTHYIHESLSCTLWVEKGEIK